MFGLALLDVAIGLSLIYLLLSIACSALMELWAQARQSRGRMLEGLLREILGGAHCLEAFLGQPRIAALRQGSAGAQAQPRRPSALPPEAFAEAVLELHRAGGAGMKDEIKSFIAQAQARHGFRPEAVRAELAGYYAQVMERLSGEFKRHTSKRLAAIGLLVVVATNTDTFSLANRLYNDAALRDGLLGQAAAYVDKHQASADPALAQVDKSLALAAAPLFGWDRKALCERVGRSFDGQDCGGLEPTGPWAYAGHWSLWLFGCFLTVMAITMGADYWFNSLQKLLAARALLRKPEAGEAKPAAAAGAAVPPAAPAAPALPADALRTGWRGFRPSATAFSPVSAFWLARAAELAYETEAERVAATARAWGLKLWRIDVAALSTQALVLGSAEFTVLAFRGTQEVRDFAVDADFPQVPGEAYGGKVHAGFKAALDPAWPALLQALAEAGRLAGGGLPPALWVTGHSLGAALATLFTSRMLRDGAGPRRQVLGLYTFGSPRCGDEAFAQGLEALAGARAFRFVNHRDLVTRVPPRALAYAHVGGPVYLDSRGELQRDPGFWYRFLDVVVPESGEALAAGLKDSLTDHGMALYRALLQQQAEVLAVLNGHN